MQVIEVIGLETFLIYNIYNERERDHGLLPSQGASQSRGEYTVNRLLLNTRLQEPSILVGDFNLHHPRWNIAASPEGAAKASSLVKWLDNYRATLLVDPEVINESGGTYNRSDLRNTSVIDLSFYTPFKKLAWTGWSYIDSTGSDHEAIVFEARPVQPIIGSLPSDNRTARFNYKLADWEKYSRQISRKKTVICQQIDNCMATNDYDSIATCVTNAITQSAENAIPRLKICERSKPWWTPELTKMRKGLTGALRHYKKHRSSQAEEEYKTVKNAYFRSVRQAKRNHWDSFLQNAVKEDVFKAYKYTKASQNTAVPGIKYTKGDEKVIAKTFEQKCEAFLTTLFPPAPMPTETMHPTISTPQSQCSNDPGIHERSSKDTGREGCKGYKWEWPELNDAEIKEAIFSFEGTAPGPDTIGALLIQKTYQAAPSILNKTYKALFEKGYHPSAWRSGIGVILPKPGKRDTSDPKSYRIIALLNCLGKVLEKIYATRLSYLANTSGLLHDSQMGGRKQRSTIDAALLLTQYIEEQRLSRKVPSRTVTTSIFLDIQGGFDRVSKEKLLEMLEKLRLPRTLVTWVDSFLSNRSIQLAFDESLMQQPTALLVGTPQGSPISPILFLLYIREIIADKAFQLSYIDDFVLTVSSTSARNNCKILEQIVAKLIMLAKEQGVAFNPKKTELMHFTTQREPITECVNVAGEVVAPKSLVKWLGIWFDPKLAFKKHVEKRVNLAMATFLGMQRLASTQKGLSFRAMRQLYIACVTTVADYGVPVWYRGNKQGKLLELYQRLQNQALPKILGAFNKSPTRAMELEAAIPPPEIRFQKTCLCYSLRTLQFRHNHPIRIAYDKATRDDLHDSGSDLGAISYIKPTTQLYGLLDKLRVVVGPNWNIGRQRAEWRAPWAKPPAATISISSSNKDKAKKEHEKLLNSLTFKDCAIFYTDGSQGIFEGQRMNACSLCEIEEDRPKTVKYWNLGAFMEVADAELTAISKVLSILQDRVAAGSANQLEAYVFIDSQAAIQKVSGYGDLAVKIRSQLSYLSKRDVKITLSWCPSHIGVLGNELADKLAKKGLKAKLSGPAYVSLSYLRRKIKERCLNNWRKCWEREEDREATGLKARGLGTHYRQVVRDNLRFSFKPNMIINPRAVQSAYIQLKLGIGFLKAYQKARGNMRTDKCSCGCKHTATHLVLQCKRYCKERCAMGKALNTGQPPSLQILFGTAIGRKALAGFLTSTNICTAKWFEEE